MYWWSGHVTILSTLHNMDQESLNILLKNYCVCARGSIQLKKNKNASQNFLHLPKHEYSIILSTFMKWVNPLPVRCIFGFHQRRTLFSLSKAIVVLVQFPKKCLHLPRRSHEFNIYFDNCNDFVVANDEHYTLQRESSSNRKYYSLTDL